MFYYVKRLDFEFLDINYIFGGKKLGTAGSLNKFVKKNSIKKNKELPQLLT